MSQTAGSIISRSAYFEKKIVPWIGMVFFVASYFMDSKGKIPEDLNHLMDFGVRVGLGVLSWYLFNRRSSGLADEVFDCGGNIEVIKDGDKFTIPISSILEVRRSRLNRGYWVFTLKGFDQLNGEVAFLPKLAGVRISQDVVSLFERIG